MEAPRKVKTSIPYRAAARADGISPPRRPRRMLAFTAAIAALILVCMASVVPSQRRAKDHSVTESHEPGDWSCCGTRARFEPPSALTLEWHGILRTATNLPVNPGAPCNLVAKTHPHSLTLSHVTLQCGADYLFSSGRLDAELERVRDDATASDGWRRYSLRVVRAADVASPLATLRVSTREGVATVECPGPSPSRALISMQAASEPVEVPWMGPR